MCVAPCLLVVPLPGLMCEVMVSYVACLPSGRASWFIYWSHDGLFFSVCGGFGEFSMFLSCWENEGSSERRDCELQIVVDSVLIYASEFGVYRSCVY
jgi:hypothetical protein